MIEPSSKNSVKRSLGYTKFKTGLFYDKKRERQEKLTRFRPRDHREHDDQRFLPKGSDQSNVSIEIGSVINLPPLWVDYYEETVEKLNSLDQIVKDTAKLINSRIKMQFGDHSDLDNQINQKAGQATHVLHECEERYKRIYEIGFTHIESESDKKTRQNVVTILATRIQEATLVVRKQQKGLLNKLKDQDDVKVNHPRHQDVSNELIQEMEGMEDIAQERDGDVNRLIDTINELSHLFKQMNQQVIEQGTLVDRIDYNVEKSLGHVRKARTEVGDAHKTQNSRCGDTCVKILVIMNLVFSLLFVLKFAHKG